MMARPRLQVAYLWQGRVLGYRFRHFKRRNFGGRMLDKAGPDADHANRWAVFPVGG